MTTRREWIKEYEKEYTEAQPKKLALAPTWIIELAVRYERLAKVKGLRRETEFRMHKLCRELDVLGVKAISDVWQYMVCNEYADAIAAKRAKPREPKPEVVKSRRPTAAATVLALLRESPVRSDDKIIAAVHAATFSDGFNASQLSWYRSQFKQGRLKGQVKPEIIEESHKKEAAL